MPLPYLRDELCLINLEMLDEKNEVCTHDYPSRVDKSKWTKNRLIIILIPINP